MQTLGNSSDAEETDFVIRCAGDLARRLNNDTPGNWAEQVRPILRQVVIGDDTVRLRIIRDSLRAALSLPALTKDTSTDVDDRVDAGLHDIVVQARVRMRGGQIKLVVGNQGDRARRECDVALIKAVARAFLWLGQLKSGDVTSVREIARTEQVTGSYVSRVLKLAFLAPDIVEAILDGRHPVDLTAERLLVHEDLPISWREQRRRLGFDPG